MRNPSHQPTLRVVDGGSKTRRKRKTRPIRYRRPVTDEVRSYDPISHREGLSSRGRIVVYIVAALGLHAAIFFGLVQFDGAPVRSFTPNKKPEKVTVNVVEPKPPKPAPLPPPPVETPPPEAVVEPVEPVAPVSPPADVQRKPVKTRRVKPSEPVAPDVAVDPINISDPTPTPAEPRRRVVGLNFESTVQGGNGPAFAVGNTRMGTTGKVAEDGSKIAPVGGQPYRPGAKQPTPNKVTTAIPTAGVTLTKPKRTATVEPAYPKTLKAQGIEGNVVVLIRISETGQVTSVKVVKGSGYPEFDDAARAAALKERFSPASRNGEPIPYTLKYTYRFRVKE